MVVEWLDSRSPESGWRMIEDCEMPRTCKCLTVGYLVVDNKREKVLAQSVADVEYGPLQANGLMVIPAIAITAMRPLTSRN